MPLGRRNLSAAQYRILWLLDNSGAIDEEPVEVVSRLEDLGYVDGLSITPAGYEAMARRQDMTDGIIRYGVPVQR